MTATDSPPDTIDAWHPGALEALPLLLAFFAYAVGLRGGFVEDDARAILGHPAVTGAVPAWEAFTRTFWGDPLGAVPPSFRPLATLSFRLDVAFFGLSPGWMHATSLAYYLACVALAHRVARAWVGRSAAVWAACLFATLPVHSENVASLVGRADVLALLFQLAALHWLDDGQGLRPLAPWRVAGAAIAYLAAMLCKESAATFPAIVGLMAVFTTPVNTPRGVVMRRWIPAGVLALVGSVYLAARVRWVPGTFGYVAPDDVVAHASFSSHVEFVLDLVARYARLLVAPVDLCAGRKYAEVYRPVGIDLLTVAGLIAVALVGWATVLDYRVRRVPLCLCALVAYWVFSSAPLPLPEAMADRFLFAPSLFLAVAVARPVSRWARRSRGRAVLAASWIGLQLMASGFYATRWENDLTLFRHAVTACPDSVHDHLRYADVLAASGDHLEAVWHYALAAEGRQHFPAEWHHPALDEELSLPARVRLRAMHGLLRVATPEGPWRRSLGAFLRARGHEEEATLVESIAPQ